MKLSNVIRVALSSLLLVLYQVSVAFAQVTPPKHDAPALVPANIHQLFLDDQSDRTGDRHVAPYGPDVNKRDEMRRTEVRVLLAAGEIRTAQDFHDAAYVFQHGQEPDDYLLGHILAVEAVVKGDVSSKWISAATLDRYLQAIGKSQVFGTQYLDKNYLNMTRHKNDPVASGSDAQEKGMTQEPFDRKLVPDTLRNDFCVPDLVQQQSNLAEFNSGRYPAGIIPPGCTR